MVASPETWFKNEYAKYGELDNAKCVPMKDQAVKRPVRREQRRIVASEILRA